MFRNPSAMGLRFGGLWDAMGKISREAAVRAMDRMDVLRAFYEGCGEDGRLRSKHGQVEFLTTMRYIERYLAPGGREIEIGAGTGQGDNAGRRRAH